jgi:dimethylaniline monooxygenase (N-oxide forming)
MDYRTKSGGGPAEQFATKSENFIYSLVEGACHAKPAVTSFTARGVRFSDGTEFDADFVVFCTGYRSSFPFLETDVADSRALFKHCFDVATGPTLGLIGLVRPGIGSIPSISEMQARWFALLCSGRLSLPDEESMQREAESDGERHRKQFPNHSDRLPHLVDYTSYMDELASRIDCKPRFRELMLRPRTARAVFTGPFSSHQYRLRGPHAKPDVVDSVYRSFPRAQSLRLIALQALSIIVCRVLVAAGFRQFRLHLSLSSRRHA